MSDKRANIPLTDVMLRRLKLKPLLIFDRVLSSSSIAGAARELNLTQPAVTKAIQELEADLDVALFERTNRGVTPTCYGNLLGTRVKTVIAELRYLTDELNTFRTGDSGHVIIGTGISASARLLPQAITETQATATGGAGHRARWPDRSIVSGTVHRRNRYRGRSPARTRSAIGAHVCVSA